MALKVGYNVFAATAQAGTDDGTPGILQAETVAQGKHKVRLQRLSDSFYWNHTTQAFQAGATAEVDEMTFLGSESERGIHPARRRLEMRLPKALLTAVGVAGAELAVYVSGAAPATGTKLQLFSY